MRWARAGALAVLILATLAAGCERELSDHPPPLRPLVYTEAPTEDVDEAAGAQAEPGYRAPQDLGLAIYQALVEHDRARFEGVFVSGGELVDLIRTPADQADEAASKVLADSEEVWSLFMPSSPSVEPVGGLRSRLQLVEYRIGKGRDLAGKVVGSSNEKEVVQHWGNDLRLGLRDSDKTFMLRVRKIVRTKNGWKVAEPLELDPTLRTYLESGMHLKPELLTSEHFPFPLEVGNFWKYRIEWVGPRPVRPAPTVAEGEPPEEAAELPAFSDPAVRISVTDLAPREGYLVATFSRETFDTEVTVESYRWLVTPLRVYPCARDCWEHLDDVGYLLGTMSQRTPMFVFPLVPGSGWGKAGRSSENNRYEVLAEQPHTSVPAGDFASTAVIVGSIEEGREERYFVPGTGIVQRKMRSGLGPRAEVLVEYRLLL